MSMSRLDQLYRSLLLTKFFTHGWGKPDNLKRLFEFRKVLSNRETCQNLVATDYPINIDKEYRDGDCRILEGHFLSPFVHHLPGIMPQEVETASFQMLLPLKWRHPVLKPVCIHLAGTGDHYFWRRRIFTARPLLKEAGMASIILENPYSDGTRKPKEQLRSSLQNVSDLFVMGGALVLESLALLHWCERQGWGPLGLSGVSMGGHGVMSGSIPWKTLQEQFFENSVYQDEIRKLIRSPEDTYRRAYFMGQQFVKDYSQSVEQVVSIHRQQKTRDTEAVSSATSAESGHDLVGSQPSSEKISPASQTARLPNSTSCDTNVNNNNLDSTSDKNQISEKTQSSHLSRDEYMLRTSTQESFSNEEQPTPAVSPSTGLAESILSAVSVEKSKDSSLRGPPSPVPSSSSLQQLLPPSSTSLPMSSSPSTSAENKHNQPPKRHIKDTSSLTLNYAKTKESQSKSALPMDSKDTLSLRHAIAKSKLMVSRQSPSSLPTDEEHLKTLQQEALDFMRGVMDECTHLGNFSVPVDPQLIIIVSARQDAYIPREGVLGLDQLWPGCEVRYVDQGHVGAVLLHQSVFRKAIIDAFDRQIKKYYQSPGKEPSHPQIVRPDQLSIKT